LLALRARDTGRNFMRPIRLIATYVFLLAAASTLSAQDKDAKAAEVKKLQGTWKVKSGEFSGKALTPPELGIDTLVVAGEKMTLKFGEKEVASYPFEVFPDRKPKGMVWTKEQDSKKATHPLIYEIDGATLKLCFPMLGKKAPAEAPKPPENFETKGKPLGLVVAEKADK
jgi:uncharacterized protein (TIGR03067 family)